MTRCFIILGILVSFIFAVSQPQAQETSGSFRGGSVLMSSDNRACSGAIEGVIRYNNGGGTSAPTSGLIAHWKMDETSGGVVTDHAGANDGTMTGGLDADTDSVAGQVATALNMNGTSDYIEVNQDWGDALPTFSYALWLKADNVTNQDLFYRLNGDSLYPRASFTPSAGDIKFQFSRSGGAQTHSSTFNTNLTTGTWYHVAFTFDNAAGNIYKLYIDGTLFNTTDFTDGTIDGGTYNLLIGRDFDQTTYFDGAMDDIRVYNRVLSAAEVSDLYNYTGTAAMQFCDGTDWTDW